MCDAVMYEAAWTTGSGVSRYGDSSGGNGSAGTVSEDGLYSVWANSWWLWDEPGDG